MDDSLSQDLVALWQSELAAMAADRELREGIVALVAAWATAMTAVAGLHDAASGGAWAAQPPGAAAAAAAPGPGRGAAESDTGGRTAGEREDLDRRIAELERRLGQLEQGDG